MLHVSHSKLEHRSVLFASLYQTGQPQQLDCLATMGNMALKSEEYFIVQVQVLTSKLGITVCVSDRTLHLIKTVFMYFCVQFSWPHEDSCRCDRNT